MTDEVPHGTHSGYSNHGCRCDECTRANREKVRRRRRERTAISAANGGIAPGPRGHGTLSTYRNWGCHCDSCRSAQANESAKHRRKAAT